MASSSEESTHSDLDEDEEYFENFFSPIGGIDQRPVVSIAAPSKLRELLYSRIWRGNTGELAIKTLQLQIDTYKQNLEASATDQTVQPITTLFDAVVQKLGKIIEEDPENADAISSFINPTVAGAVWKWTNIPYPAFCSIQRQVVSRTLGTDGPHTKGKEKDSDHDVDQWILRNEEALRQRLQDPTARWPTGLVSLDQGDDVFTNSTLKDQYREITRGALDGFMCLDKKRSPSVYIQPTNEKYREKFEELTCGQLAGLDWSNVFVAGGIALASLLCVNTESPATSQDQWKSSDIDIYIYGLGPPEVNEKIKHIFTTFKKNLPLDAPITVLKNSKTISFLSSYPHRRFQIILKLVRNPAEVLLNFDLDICAMGYDGTSLRMLPRAARALETGYNTFTMDMLQGHYLGNRRATQEHRVFKYADRGYGIRILPSYLDAIKTIDLKSLKMEGQFDKKLKERAKASLLDINTIVTAARKFFKLCYDEEMKMRWGKLISQGFHIDTKNQVTSEPLRRSCLTGFELFFRHVALWETQQETEMVIPHTWASTMYEETFYGISYDETPKYEWNESFSSESFEGRIKSFNENQLELINTSINMNEKWSDALAERYPEKDSLPVIRIATGKTVEEVLAQDLHILIWMPPPFIKFARELIQEISADFPNLELGKILEETWPIDEQKLNEYNESDNLREQEPLSLVIFRLSSTTMYQQLDRRLDELYEIIWSFMHANNAMPGTDGDRCKVLRRQFSNRALRRKTEDEYKDFASWIVRSPGTISGYAYGEMGDFLKDEDCQDVDYRANEVVIP